MQERNTRPSPNGYACFARERPVDNLLPSERDEA